MDSDEAHLSPQAGRLIRQLLDEDSDPMLSPRFYAYGQSRQYLDDTEVPPSPPNSHSFMRYVCVADKQMYHRHNIRKNRNGVDGWQFFLTTL